ncbi:four-carbon acid sugar kinase family protein, partial [Burkholderia multivorans]|uniref:four-carbon acid sugar kinase family protein n=1 Tax=Burkholderia multivorans TaxID=87883 RepID=UPI003D35C70A
MLGGQGIDDDDVGTGGDAGDHPGANGPSALQDPGELDEVAFEVGAVFGDPVGLLACRIDTTLRGNVGVTAEAALEARRQLAQAAGGVPRRVIGLCVPAFPAAGRT